MTNEIERLVGLKGLSHLKFSDLKREDILREALLQKSGSLDHRFHSNRILEQNIRLLVELVRSTLMGEYNNLSVLAFAHILVAFDYFLKHQDRKPDSQAGGFDDDFEEISRVLKDFKDEIEQYKGWRLRNAPQA